MLKTNDLHWVAGFLEGEGSFTKCGSAITISAVQVNVEPIDKLHNLFDGYKRTYYRKEIKTNNGRYHRWEVYGRNAASLMMTLYPMLSEKRKNRIKELLAIWKKQPFRNGDKFYCNRGHSLSGDNLYIDPGSKKRRCRTCKKMTQSILYNSKRKLIFN